MEDYLLSAKVGLLNTRHLATRKKTGTLSDIRAVHDGGIPTLAMLGSQNAMHGIIPPANKSLDIIAKELKLLPKEMSLIKPNKPILSGQTQRLPPKEMGLTPKEMGLVPPTEMKINSGALREVKERKKDEAEAQSESVKQPSQRPPFSIPTDQENEAEYGTYLRTRYPGSVGRLEYDKMIEGDIAFTAVLNYAHDIQKAWITAFKDPQAASRDFTAFFGNLAVELSRELAKEVVKKVIPIVGGEFGVNVTYTVPDFIKNKIAESAQNSIPNKPFQSHQDVLNGIKHRFNAIFEGEPREWKSKVVYYTGFDMNTQTEKTTSDFQKDQEERREKEAKKKDEELTKTHAELKAIYDPIIKAEQTEDFKLQNKADVYSRNKAMNEGKLAIYEATPFDIRERKNFETYKKYVIENNIKTDYAKLPLATRNKLRNDRIKARVYKMDWKKMGYQKNIDTATKEYDNKYNWMLG